MTEYDSVEKIVGPWPQGEGFLRSMHLDECILLSRRNHVEEWIRARRCHLVIESPYGAEVGWAVMADNDVEAEYTCIGLGSTRDAALVACVLDMEARK